MEDNLKIDNSNQQSDISHNLTGNRVVAGVSDIDKILKKKGLFKPTNNIQNAPI